MQSTGCPRKGLPSACRCLSYWGSLQLFQNGEEEQAGLYGSAFWSARPKVIWESICTQKEKSRSWRGSIPPLQLPVPCLSLASPAKSGDLGAATSAPDASYSSLWNRAASTGEPSAPFQETLLARGFWGGPLGGKLQSSAGGPEPGLCSLGAPETGRLSV